MSKLLNIQSQEALDTIQNCFFPVPNRTFSDFGLVENAFRLLQAIGASVEQFCPTKGKLYVDAIETRVN